HTESFAVAISHMYRLAKAVVLDDAMGLQKIHHGFNSVVQVAVFAGLRAAHDQAKVKLTFDLTLAVAIPSSRCRPVTITLGADATFAGDVPKHGIDAGRDVGRCDGDH